MNLLRLLSILLTVGLFTLPAMAVDADPPQVAALKSAGAAVGREKAGGWRVDFRDAVPSDDAWKLMQALDVRKFSSGGKTFDDAQLGRLCAVASIEGIFLNGPAVTDAGLPQLSRLPHLQSFVVHHSTILTGVGLTALKDSANLRMIGFGGCSKIDDASVEAISQLKQLRELQLGHDRNTRRSFEAIASLPNLEVLMLTPNWNPQQYNAADFASFAPLKNLKEIELHDMSLPYDDGLDHLAALPNLKTLRLLWCIVSEADLAKLKARLPDLKVDVQHPGTPEQAKKWDEAMARMKAKK